MIPNDRFRPGLLEIPQSMLPEHPRGKAGDLVIGMVTEIKTNIITGKQIVRIDLETPAQAAEKILREAEDGR